jgi:hypothetical protein
MNLSRDARLMTGVTLITVPTIMYGGLVLLGILSGGAAGVSAGDLKLDETQWALFRAGHAHAGVLVILSLVVQVLLDSARLGPALSWTARIAAPLAAIAISGGFFGLAFAPDFRWLTYFGVVCLTVAMLAAGVGLLRNLRPAA